MLVIFFYRVPLDLELHQQQPATERKNEALHRAIELEGTHRVRTHAVLLLTQR